MKTFFIFLSICGSLVYSKAVDNTSTTATNTTADIFNVEEALRWEAKNSDKNVTFLMMGGLRDPDILDKYLAHVVSLRSRNPQKYFGDNHFCAGTIFDKDLVLTTAHCVMDKRRVVTAARQLLLVAGTPNRLNHTDKTIQFPVYEVKANTNFIRNNLNDIAIIRLKTPIPEDNELIKMFKLPTGPPTFDSECTVLGWGRLGWNGPLPALATYLKVTLYNHEFCRKTFPKKYKDGMLCAGGGTTDHKEAPCRGDSGGPLICNDELTGIISWTIGCDSFHNATLYTDVWYNMEWIKKNMEITGGTATIPAVTQISFMILGFVFVVVLV